MNLRLVSFVAAFIAQECFVSKEEETMPWEKSALRSSCQLGITHETKEYKMPVLSLMFSKKSQYILTANSRPM
jgi:hypothetical protein